MANENRTQTQNPIPKSTTKFTRAHLRTFLTKYKSLVDMDRPDSPVDPGRCVPVVNLSEKVGAPTTDFMIGAPTLPRPKTNTRSVTVTQEVPLPTFEAPCTILPRGVAVQLVLGYGRRGRGDKGLRMVTGDLAIADEIAVVLEERGKPAATVAEPQPTAA